jgi:choline kinase
LLLDADVLCAPTLLSRLVDSEHENAVLLDPRAVPSGEEMMLAARQGRVWHIGRQVSVVWDTVGESVGFYKLTEETSRRLRQSVELCFRQGKIHTDYERALLPVFSECVVGYELVGDAPWIEIDTPADVERAEREIIPQLLAEEGR